MKNIVPMTPRNPFGFAVFAVGPQLCTLVVL